MVRSLADRTFQLRAVLAFVPARNRRVESGLLRGAEEGEGGEAVVEARLADPRGAPKAHLGDL